MENSTPTENRAGWPPDGIGDGLGYQTTQNDAKRTQTPKNPQKNDSTGDPKPKIAKKTRKARAAAPEFRDFQPSPTVQTKIHALKTDRGWDDARVLHEYTRMVNHHGMKGTAIINWSMAFMNWIMNAERFESGAGRPETRLELHRRLMEEGSRNKPDPAKPPEPYHPGLFDKPTTYHDEGAF